MEFLEKRSNMDETINILNDTIIDALINILLEALQNSEIGKFLKKGSDAILKGMESMKNNLKSELKEIAVLPEAENSASANQKNSLMKNFNNNFNIIKNKFSYEKIEQGIKKLIEIIQIMVTKNILKEFKFPKEAKTIIYINSKFGKNPLKK